MISRGDVSGSSRSLVPIRGRPVPSNQHMHEDQSNSDHVIGALIADPMVDVDSQPVLEQTDVLAQWNGYASSESDSLFVPLSSHVGPHAESVQQSDDGDGSGSEFIIEAPVAPDDSSTDLRHGGDHESNVRSLFYSSEATSDRSGNGRSIFDDDSGSTQPPVATAMTDELPVEMSLDSIANAPAIQDTFSEYWNNPVDVEDVIDHIGPYELLFSSAPALYLLEDPLDDGRMEAVNALAEGACRDGFRPLYPQSSAKMSHEEVHNMIKPLTQGTPLTEELIYNLLRALIPMLLIVDGGPDAWDALLGEWNAQGSASDAYSQVQDELSATLTTSEPIRLIVATKQKRRVFIIGGPTVPEALIPIFQTHGYSVEPEVRSTV